MKRLLTPAPETYSVGALHQAVGPVEGINIVEVEGVDHLAVYVDDDSPLTESQWRKIVSDHDPADEPAPEPTLSQRLAALEARMDRASQGPDTDAVKRADLKPDRY